LYGGQELGVKPENVLDWNEQHLQREGAEQVPVKGVLFTASQTTVDQQKNQTRSCSHTLTSMDKQEKARRQ